MSGDISGGVPSSTSGGEEWVINKKGRGKDAVALFHKQKPALNFTSLLVSCSSGYGNMMADILAGLVRLDEFHCGGFSKKSLNPQNGLQSLQYAPVDNSRALLIKLWLLSTQSQGPSSLASLWLVEQTPVRPNQHELVLVSECYEGKVRVIPEP